MTHDKITIITDSHQLPPMRCAGLFHSAELFRLYEQTPRHSPYMVVAWADDGSVASHLLAVTRYRWSFFPPYFYRQCQVIGEGEYATGQEAKGELFAAMLDALTHSLRRKVLYVEFSNLSTKMFGYRDFRKAGYFPVRWMSIHNSLHSRTPEERIDERMLNRIRHAEAKGVTTAEVASDDDFNDFSHLMRQHNRLKPRRYIPDDAFFRGMVEAGAARIFVTRYKGKAIGCCACAYSEDDAFLWYTASLRKTFAMLHPDAVTVWAAICHAHAHGYRHIRFMDVGLPFRKNPFRRFILSFGGKPVATFRWFHVTIGWLNSLLSWLYHD